MDPHAHDSFGRTYLTEQEISGYFVPYLKGFYQNRFEVMLETFTNHGPQASANGIKADGLISFLKDNEEPFAAAFECTNHAVAEEVKFKHNTVFFIWDCFAFSLIMTAFVYGYFYFFNQAALNIFGILGNLGLIFASLILFFSLWYFAMQNWSKYRYIYAIEQFHQYHADEQWVAIGSDVFPGRKNPFFAELKVQCMYHGIGLVIVHPDGLVEPMIAPSTLGAYGGGRKMRHWITESPFFSGLGSDMETAVSEKSQHRLLKPLFNILRPINHYGIRPLKNLIWGILGAPFTHEKSPFSRYMRSYPYQKYMVGVGVVLLGLMSWKYLTTPNIALEADRLLAEETKKRAENQTVNPEDVGGYRVDDNTQSWYKSHRRQYPDETVLAEDTITQRLAQDNTHKPVEANVSTDAAPVPTSPKVIRETDLNPYSTAKAETQNPVAYSARTPTPQRTAKSASSTKPAVTYRAPSLDGGCDFLSRNSGWVIQDGFYSTRESALQRQLALLANGIHTKLVPKSCSGPANNGNWVFFHEIFTSRTDADAALDTYKKALKRYGLDIGTPFLKKL